MSFQGSQIQNAIYVSGESPWPIAPEEWETRATDVLKFGSVASTPKLPKPTAKMAEVVGKARVAEVKQTVTK